VVCETGVTEARCVVLRWSHTAEQLLTKLAVVLFLLQPNVVLHPSVFSTAADETMQFIDQESSVSHNIRLQHAAAPKTLNNLCKHTPLLTKDC
jgi:hypothetical protein